MIKLTQTKNWKKLLELAKETKDKRQKIKDFFDSEPNRLKNFSYQLGPMYVDFSKNLLSEEVRENLNSLAKELQIKEKAKAMFAGEKINNTEDRAVLHVALRNVKYEDSLFLPKSNINLDGQDVMPEVCNVLNRMAVFTEKVRSGKWKGATRKAIDTIVNIGIGGSDLGPRMITNSLKPFSQRELAVKFVSNVDGSDIAEVLRDLDPETTLFIVASKTFTTQETMTNANSAKDWFLESMSEEDIAKHFVAASTAEKLVVDFGIDKENMFPFWDWVGGRYSSPSAIGLAVMLAIGAEYFASLLAGYNIMDEHFKSSSVEENIPLQMALLGVWYNNFLDAQSYAILPYDQYLDRFAAYMQQTDMESNGKYVTKEGEKVDYQTGPIVWGEPGTNGQHSFYQLIHHGTKLIPADFIASINTHNDISDHHQKLLANFLAQPEALMNGLSKEELIAQNCPKKLIPHKTFEGNRPTTTILLDQLNPQTLGMLIALYEHKVFCQGLIWDVNSFDQWGVQLGKVGANQILKELKKGKVGSHDPSTTALMGKILNGGN